MKRKRPRCSIRHCLWPAKYVFFDQPPHYYECWYHGGPNWLFKLGDFFCYPMRKFYWWIRGGFR